MKTAVAIRHVPFEDLGLLQPMLQKRGYRVHYYEAGADEIWTIDSDAVDLLVVLGGPMGADETNRYPFLAEEIDLIRTRLRSRRPTLGICLGAQLIAVAAGGGIRTMPAKEIGLAPVALTAAGMDSCLFALSAAVPVLHWHGDEAVLPEEAVVLASTAQCANQAFRIGSTVLGLQFHLEAELQRIREWTQGHAAELAEAGIDPLSLESEADDHAERSREAGERVFATWLDAL